MRRLALSACLAAVAASAPAYAVPVTFTALAGVTGGSPADTAVFEADLSSLTMGQVAAVVIQDNSSTSAGSPGRFSGFDLDAIVLSRTLITNASQANGLVRAGAFDFAHTTLTDGVQTPPVDPALFGTAGGQVDPSVATLNSFDGDSTTAIPGAFGFVSLGVGGKLALNLLSPVVTGGPLYLYIGEVGNNGEVAASGITVLSTPVGVPEPAALAVLGFALAGLAVSRRSGRDPA